MFRAHSRPWHSPSRTLARRLAGTLVTLGLLVPAARTVSAETVRLRTGETIVGRVIDARTNEQMLVIEDYQLGGIRELSWDALTSDDMVTIQTRLGLKAIGDVSVPCDVITYRLNDGGETMVRGKVLGEEGAFLLLKNRSAKEPLRIAKDRIVAREVGECDPQEIWSPDELADEQKAKLNPQDARGWMSYAQYCEQVGAYPQALQGYETAAADDTYLNRKMAQDGAVRVAAIIKDKEAVTTLNDLKVALGSELWVRVRTGIEGFSTKHPDASPPVLQKLEALKNEFKARRLKAFSLITAKRFEVIVRDLIKKKVAPKDTAYNDVQAWIRKDALEKAWELLLAELQKKDPAVTLEEAKAFFEARPKKESSWRKARYGSGSFIIEPAKVLPKTGTKQPTKPQQGNSGGGPAPQLDLPKPPTRDEWWPIAPTELRAEFWWAGFVEKSGLYEVDPKRDRVVCSKCEGEGTISFTLSTGQAATVLCPRCGGMRFDLSVKYR